MTNNSLQYALNIGHNRKYVSQVAQSVQCLAMAWTTGQSRFDPWQR
jgi:hypothetical protein